MIGAHAASIPSTRRWAVVLILALGLLPLAAASPPITGATTMPLKDYNALPGRRSFGDTFTTAWLPGDRQYICYDDGFSWQGEIDPNGQNLALGEVFGQPSDDTNFICHLVNPMSFFGGISMPMLPDGRMWKQQGVHYADGVLYLAVTGLGTTAQYNSPFGDG